jgi:hypothetical protein
MSDHDPTGPTSSDPQTHLLQSRQRLEDRLDALRTAVEERTGGRLGSKAWTLPVLAAAVGFSLAMWLRHRRRRERAGVDDADIDYLDF